MEYVKDIEFDINEDTEIKFFQTCQITRDKATSITLEKFRAMCSGQFPDSRVLECRKLPADARKKYKEANLPCVQFQQTPDGGFLPLMPIDYENCSGDMIPTECIFMRFKSVGGVGECIVLRLPDHAAISPDAWGTYAKRVEKYLNIISTKGQTSIDRMRFISHDEKFSVNWQAEPYILPEASNNVYKLADDLKKNCLYIRSTEPIRCRHKFGSPGNVGAFPCLLAIHPGDM